jgi:hypothetical protein
MQSASAERGVSSSQSLLLLLLQQKDVVSSAHTHNEGCAWNI